MKLANALTLTLLTLAAPALHAAPATQPATAAPGNATPTDRAIPAAAKTSRADFLFASLHNPNDGRVLVAAHRGDWHNFPENSLAGYESAIAMGVDILEVDLRKTRDGHFIILHDKTLDRTTTGTGKVSEHTLAQLRNLRLKDANGNPTDHPIPTLDQLMALARDRVLVYLDKTDDCIDEVYPVLKSLNAERHAFFFGRRPVTDLRARFPVIDQVNYLPKIGDQTADPADYIDDLQETLKPPVYIFDFNAPDAPVLDTIPAIKTAGARVWVSPLSPDLAGGKTDELALTDPNAHWGWLLDKGATIFCTDRPRELLAFLRARNLHE